MYAIAGATGHIGKAIAETLLSRGKQVRVLGRAMDRLQPLVLKGAEPFVGTLEDSALVSRAFDGAEAVFVMIPPNMRADDFRTYQNRLGAAIAEAIKIAGVTYVVNLSSLGAHLAKGTGPVTGLHDQEQRLNKLRKSHVLHLRPAFFMENLLMNIDLIRGKGITGSPMRGDLRFPLIATRDVAKAAADAMLTQSIPDRSVRDLLGQRDSCMNEITEILGRAIGKPDLHYVQFSYEDAKQAMVGMGLSVDMARRYVEMYQAFNEGRIMSGLARTAENTTETPIEEFAKEFAAMYKAGIAA